VEIRSQKNNLVGRMDLHLRLCRPLDESAQDVKVSTKSTLVIDEHCKPGSFKLPEPAGTTTPTSPESPAPQPEEPANQLPADWDSLDRIVSYDALEAEVARCQEIAQTKSSNPFDSAEWEARAAQAQTKMTVLEMQMGNGVLDQDVYMGQLDRAIADCRKFAMILKREGRKDDALVLLRQIKVMEAEVAATNAAGEEEEEEA
jgi:hypothetical protein